MQAAHQKTEQIRQAINCEDYKKAIKLSSKIADKSDLAKVMQAYALERLGRRDEALDICEQLLSSANKDDRVFIWISHVYSMAKKFHEIAKLQQKLFEQTPPKPVDRYCLVGVHYFEALCKTYDFTEAQTQALRLVKVNEGNSVLNVTSIWLWASTLAFLKAEQNCAHDDSNLQLSEAFFNKAMVLSKEKVTGLAIKRWILIRRNKFTEALQTLQFLPDESIANRLWMKCLLLRLVDNDESQQEEFQVLLDLIKQQDSSDDFRAFARLARLASTTQRDQRETLLQCILAIRDSNPKLRGPSLARVRVEFEQFISSTTAMKENTETALRDATLDYLKSKGHLPASVFDLQNDLQVFSLNPPSLISASPDKPGDLLPVKAQICPYLIPTKLHVDLDRESRRWPIESCLFRVSPTTRASFLNDLTALFESNNNKANYPVYHQVLRYCGQQENSAVEKLDELIRRYLNLGLSSNVDLSIRDDWMFLAAHLLLDSCNGLNSAEQKMARLLFTSAILHYQIELSPDNFQLKLALNDIYGHRLGAAKPAFEIFKLLRVKQIQFDALGFIPLADLSACGYFEEAEEYSKSIAEFNSRARGETADCFAEAFKFVEQSSPIEIVRLENRLKDSYQQACAIIERCLCSLMPQTRQKSVSKKQDEEDQTEGRKSALFTRLKVEIDDPSRGESHVCLSELRLAAVLKRREDISTKLCVNSDFDVQACFDPPFSRNFQKQIQEVLPKSGPCARIPREAQNSKEFLSKWKQRSDDWMNLRLLVLEGLIRPINEEKLKEVTDLIAKLNLLTIDWSKSLWILLPQFLEVLSTGKFSDSVIIELQKFEQTWPSQSDRLESLFTDNPRQFLSDFSMALSHAGFCIFAVVARLNHAYKKQTKAKPFPFDSSAFLKIRELAGKVFQKVAQLLEKLRQHLQKQIAHVYSTLEALAKLFEVGNHFDTSLKEVHRLVYDSHMESLRRLKEVCLVFATFELYQT